MKKYIVSVLFVSLLLVSGFVYAENENKINREDFKAKLSAQREQLKEKITTNREALRIKLQTIKNEKKQNSVLKISDNIEKINERATDRLEMLVNNIEKVLNNIQTRTDKAKESGIDVTSVQSTIDNAKTAISEARDAINTQSQKVYTINVTDEKTLRATVKTVRDIFHADIKAVQEKIKLAHEAVRASAKALAKVISPAVPKEEGSENEE
jgi:hypothetical protein